MISRLVISPRKAADTSLVQVWDRDHFTVAESGEYEIMNFAIRRVRNARYTHRDDNVWIGGSTCR